MVEFFDRQVAKQKAEMDIAAKTPATFDAVTNDIVRRGRIEADAFSAALGKRDNRDIDAHFDRMKFLLWLCVTVAGLVSSWLVAVVVVVR